jgi:hypothetical protein
MRPISFAPALLACLILALGCAPGSYIEVSGPTAEAKLVLDAPDTVCVGELVVFDVSQSDAANIRWEIDPPTPDFLVIDGGDRAVFSARATGEFRLVIAAARGNSVDVLTRTISVSGPPVTPTADDPLTMWIPFWNSSYNLPEDECYALADGFDAIADRAGELSGPAEWIEATATSNRTVLGDSIGNWKPLLNKISEVLLDNAKSGALATPEDHEKMWREVAKGLRACYRPC